MSLRVYYADSNPAIDRFAFRQSNARGKELIKTGQGRLITLQDGRTAVQLYRSQAAREPWSPMAETASKGSGIGLLRFVLPESSKKIQRESLIANVRNFYALA